LAFRKQHTDHSEPPGLLDNEPNVLLLDLFIEFMGLSLPALVICLRYLEVDA